MKILEYVDEGFETGLLKLCQAGQDGVGEWLGLERAWPLYFKNVVWKSHQPTPE